MHELGWMPRQKKRTTRKASLQITFLLSLSFRLLFFCESVPVAVPALRSARTRIMRKKNSNNPNSLGQIFTNRKAAQVFKSKQFNSDLNANNNEQLRVIFLNQTDRPLILCWVDDTGGLHHYYKLEPLITSLTSLGQRNEIQLNHHGTHMEHTAIGHSFVVGTCANEDENEDENISTEKGKNEIVPRVSKRIGDVIAAYRPTQRRIIQKNASMTGASNDDASTNEICVHLVTIMKSNGLPRKILKNHPYQMQVSQCDVDSTPLDTSGKIYKDMTIGGWPCKCEDGLFDKNKSINDNDTGDDSGILEDVRNRLDTDIRAAAKKLPPKACKILMESTPIWINKQQKYGPKCVPVTARGMCFHPQPHWLVENGMSKDKCGGVELYEACKYLNDVDLWHGKGGVILHELSHAYHCKVLQNGYDNKEIIACYEAAMKESLYESVKVHNRKGGTDTCRAYACTDPMEYFAELSTAFLGGIGEDEDLEFNKWYPFNRKQIKEHDPRAYEMLQKMWYGDSEI